MYTITNLHISIICPTLPSGPGVTAVGFWPQAISNLSGISPRLFLAWPAGKAAYKSRPMVLLSTVLLDRLQPPTLIMHHFITLALATAALAAPEADPTLVRAFHAGSGIAHPISSINNVPVIDTRSPYAAGIHAFSPYAAYAGLPATYATGFPATYATGLPATYATGYPYTHSYGKREAEAEADPQMIYSGLPYTGLHTAYTGLPTTYATGYPTVQAVPAVHAVHAVAPAVSSVYSHIPATYSAIPATYSTIPTTYSTSPLIKALYKPAVVAPTHTLTSYNSPTQYSAVSNGVFGPKYIAKNGPVEHIVKREAEAEAEAQMVYTGLPYTGLHTAYTGLPTTYATGYPVVQTVPAVQAVHAPVVSSVYSHHVPATYAVASPLAHNGNHGVVNTVYGATHSSNVGICLNNVGEQVAC